MILKYLSFIEMSKICKLSKTISHFKKKMQKMCFVLCAYGQVSQKIKIIFGLKIYIKIHGMIY
jgi:hypothetical protein